MLLLTGNSRPDGRPEGRQHEWCLWDLGVQPPDGGFIDTKHLKMLKLTMPIFNSTGEKGIAPHRATYATAAVLSTDLCGCVMSIVRCTLVA